MDATALAAAYQGLKFGKEVFETLSKGAVQAEAQQKILTALEKLSDAQAAMFDMRDELFKLQEANAKLRKDAEELESWEKIFAGYALTTTTGGAVVYVFSGDPAHFACPSCAHKKKLEFLQDNRTMSGKFRCVGCEAEYPINPIKRMPRTQVHPGY
jgi:hypothetical protein